MASSAPQPQPRPQESAQELSGPRVAGSELRQELEATIRARQELGADYEPMLIEAFLERLDRTIDARIDDRLGARPDLRRSSQPAFEKEMVGALAATMALGIPVTAVAGGIGGLAGILVVWLAVAFIWLAILGYLPRPRG